MIEAFFIDGSNYKRLGLSSGLLIFGVSVRRFAREKSSLLGF